MIPHPASVTREAWKYSNFLLFVGQATPPAGWAKDTVHAISKLGIRFHFRNNLYAL
jgi:hypothetical protein